MTPNDWQAVYDALRSFGLAGVSIGLLAAYMAAAMSD